MLLRLLLLLTIMPTWCDKCGCQCYFAQSPRYIRALFPRHPITIYTAQIANLPPSSHDYPKSNGLPHYHPVLSPKQLSTCTRTSDCPAPATQSISCILPHNVPPKDDPTELRLHQTDVLCPKTNPPWRSLEFRFLLHPTRTLDTAFRTTLPPRVSPDVSRWPSRRTSKTGTELTSH